MSDLTSIIFRRGNYDYRLTLSWDEGQLSEGVIDLGVSVGRRPIEPSVKEKPITLKANVCVEADQDKGALLKIKIDEKEIYSIPVSELLHEDSVVGRALESVHSAAYGGDPLVGCLLRSGCSATVGQIITCKDDTASIPWFRQRAVAIGRCLRQHIPDILVKTMIRATRCAFKAGF